MATAVVVKGSTIGWWLTSQASRVAGTRRNAPPSTVRASGRPPHPRTASVAIVSRSAGRLVWPHACHASSANPEASDNSSIGTGLCDATTSLRREVSSS